MLRAVGLLLAVGVLLVFWGWWRGGGFSPLVVGEETVSMEWVAGLEHAGPYPEMMEPYLRAGEILDSLGWETFDGMGWYLDDPTSTAPEACRGVYGRIVEAQTAARWSQGDEVPGGLVVRPVPGGRALTVHWPVASDWAYIVGPLRVYPALTEAMEASGSIPLAVYERYDVEGKEVMYVMVMAPTDGAENSSSQ